MHLAPIWDPYIDREKSTIKKKVLKPDTPQEIKEAFEKHQEELKKPVKGYVDKQLNQKNKVMNMEPNRPLIIPKELMSPDAETKKNWDLFDDMLKQTEELIKSGKLD